MWREIEAKKRRLDALRPLAASLRALDAWYDVELTYSSNAIEGNAFTRSETAVVPEEGLTVRGKQPVQGPPRSRRSPGCPCLCYHRMIPLGHGGAGG